MIAPTCIIAGLGSTLKIGKIIYIDLTKINGLLNFFFFFETKLKKKKIHY